MDAGCFHPTPLIIVMKHNLIAYTDDPMSLITAIVLIKRKFTVDEIIDNYYYNVNVFDNNLF